jgi:hypothetical protein
MAASSTDKAPVKADEAEPGYVLTFLVSFNLVDVPEVLYTVR